MKHIWASIFLMLLFVPHGKGKDTPEIAAQDWSFSGIFGTFDRAALQRGFQVYKEVCASCHGLKQLYYRNLKDLGFNDGEIKAIAKNYIVKDGPNDEGEMFDRPAEPQDGFVSPYPNEQAARAINNGAYPLDLSLITNAREGGPDYVYALLTGYKDPPSGITVMDGMYYNTAYKGNQIAMAPPLSEGIVTYSDGTPATVANMAHDVVTFLHWAADPKLEERKSLGIAVLLYLLAFTCVMYLLMVSVWRRVK